jgi:transposase
MAEPLSQDFRERVLEAIAEGSSGRQAALRFGVSAASVSRWRALERVQGDARPKAMGGDRRSQRIEAHADLILALVEKTKDMTLEELRVVLVGRGLSFSYGALWRFFDRRGYTVKKRPRTRASKSGRTS